MPSPAEVVRPWPTDAEPVRFRELIVGAPALRSGEDVAVCSSKPGLGDLLARLDGALSYGSLDEAEALYRDGLARVPCDGAATSAILGELGMLGGLVAARRNEPDTARVRFAEAKSWADVQWNSAWPPELRAAFDAAAVPGETFGLTVIPAGRVQIDGRAVDGVPRLPPGRHLVRVADQGMWVTMPPVDDQLVVPLAYPPDSLAWMGIEARRSDFAALLATTLGEGRYAVVTDGNVTWAGTTGRTDWVETGRLDAGPAEPEVPERPARKSPVPVVLSVLGGVVVASGAAVAGQSWAQASRYEKAPDPAWTVDDHRAAKSRYTAGLVGSGVGVALLGTGVAFGLTGSF
ncbi:MAG: hypothetical protein R3F61_14850 [Myxococcota bacterium]